MNIEAARAAGREAARCQPMSGEQRRKVREVVRLAQQERRAA